MTVCPVLTVDARVSTTVRPEVATEFTVREAPATVTVNAEVPAVVADSASP